MNPLHNRPAMAGLMTMVSAVVILILTYTLGHNMAAVILLDRDGFFPYPFTIQNLMHVLFFIGLGELWIRRSAARAEKAWRNEHFLPEDEHTVLQASDLSGIRRSVAGKADSENGFIPYLIQTCILQFQASRSVDQTVSVLNSSLELISHRVDLRYTMIRYLIWVIPTIGFIGTVIGIAATLAMVDPADPDLAALTASLAVAFNTTLVALIHSAILVFVQHLVQENEERAVNDAGQYVLQHLINRLYSGT